MAKKRIETQEGERRRSRKEVLRERRHERQTREIRLAVGAVVGLLIIVLLAALIIEYAVRPGQPVVTVNETSISLRDWQNRVRYQRAQFIVGLEEQLEAFQDLGLVQQFSQQQMALLQQPEVLGELVLEQMIDDELVRQAAVGRGITVSDEEVDALIGEQFGYYGGALPTATSTATATIEPTPTLTPIPTEVITETVPTNTPAPTFTPGPTATVRPSPTAVSEEAFTAEFGELMGRLRALGVREESYRQAVRAQIYREKLAEALSESEGVEREAEMVSVYVLTTDDEDVAQETRQSVEDHGFLETWNLARSQPVAAADDEPRASAAESLWRTREQLEQQYGPTMAAEAFALSVGEPSEVLTQTVPSQTAEGAAAEDTLYHLIQVSGREVRPLSEAAIASAQQQLVTDLVNAQRQSGAARVVINDLWRTRVPNQPILDPSFLAPPPTQPPLLPTEPPVTPTPVPEADE